MDGGSGSEMGHRITQAVYVTPTDEGKLTETLDIAEVSSVEE